LKYGRLYRVEKLLIPPLGFLFHEIMNSLKIPQELLV
jgi:hypothetical protein